VPGPDLLLAYGPVPGVEFLPYFFGLLGWLGLACAACFWPPLAALLRRLRGSKGDSSQASSSSAEEVLR
jgi:hypothetical protein